MIQIVLGYSVQNIFQDLSTRFITKNRNLAKRHAFSLELIPEKLLELMNDSFPGLF